MKKIIFITMLIFITCSLGYSQSKVLMKNKEKKEYIEARKIAFITTELQLTSIEAQSFWPLYNEFDRKKNEILKSNKCIMRSEKLQLDEISEKEIEEMADNDIIMSEKILVLRKEYHQKYKEIFPIQKVLKLYIAEKKFRRMLLKDYKHQNCNREN